MARDRLSGFRDLDDISFHDVEDEPGVYIFFDEKDGEPVYVGRSDTSLFRRMEKRGYRYYRYKHCDTPEEAWIWECEYYHKHKDILENINHPARPAGVGDVPCPICGDWDKFMDEGDDGGFFRKIKDKRDDKGFFGKLKDWF